MRGGVNSVEKKLNVFFVGAMSGALAISVIVWPWIWYSGRHSIYVWSVVMGTTPWHLLGARELVLDGAHVCICSICYRNRFPMMVINAPREVMYGFSWICEYVSLRTRMLICCKFTLVSVKAARLLRVCVSAQNVTCLDRAFKICHTRINVWYSLVNWRKNGLPFLSYWKYTAG